MTDTRILLIVLAAVMAIAGATRAHGQSGSDAAYPAAGKTVRIIAPYAPGSGLDRTARHFAEKLGTLWSAPVVVENRPGAGGVVGAEFVARSAADGYVIMMGNSSLTITTNQMEIPPFDIEKDFSAVSLARPLIEGSRMRALAVTNSVRSKILPDVPTFPEQGYAKLDAVPWLGFMMPARTPPAIVNKLSADLNKLVLQPDTIKAMAEMGQEAAGMTPEQFTRFVRSERAKWKELVEFARMPGSGKEK